MLKQTKNFSVLLIVVSLFVAGCATTRARKPDPVAVEQSNQINQLQQELQAKDQQIQDLQYQLNSSSSTGSNYTSSGGGKSSIIRVSGVSVIEVQKALAHAGYDPGPIDGRAGKKTKAAIKKFQRDTNLNADGIVGEKTWARLK